MSLITNILAVLGIILIVVLIVYVYRKYNDKKKKTTTTPTYPPSEYMEEVGTKCPDLWSLTPHYQTGKYTCVNTGNAPVANKGGYKCEDRAVFSKMEKWPLDDKKRQKELASRCEWVEKCGPTGSTPASWIGIDNLC